MTLWWSNPTKAYHITIGFNPCSIGMTLWCPADILAAGVQILFQSLFYWNDLMVEQSDEGLSHHNRFQSLFYWNDLMVSSRHSRCGRSDPVSILVLLEWPYGVGEFIVAFASLSVSILVLLEWPYGADQGVSRLRALYSFNPCSIGMTLWWQAFCVQYRV